MKLCKDCRWYIAESLGPAFDKCLHEQTAEHFVDPVRGESGSRPAYCQSARGPVGKCGVDGRLFEAADEGVAG